MPLVNEMNPALRAEGELRVHDRQNLMEVRHVSVSVDSPPEAVYGFAARIENPSVKNVPVLQ